MKIGFLATRIIKYDAIGNYTAAVVEELSKDNKVDLYAFSIEREMPENVGQYTYTGKNEHSFSSVLFSITKIYSLAKKLSEYDLLIIVGPDITILPSIHLAKHFNPKLKLVWNFHGITPSQFHKKIRDKLLTKLRKKIHFCSMKRSNYVIVDSNYIKKELEGDIEKRKLKVIYLGVDTNQVNKDHNSVTTKENQLNKKFVLLYVGRLVPSKHIDFLITSLLRLEEDVVLLIIGSGENRNSLEYLVESLNIEGRVIFAGKASDEELPKYYAASDVFVTASLHEGFCVPIIESFASGKPVIVPKRTAMPEIAGDAGLVYEPGSINDFVSKVKMLKNDSNLREQLSRKASERSKKFDLKNSVKIYEEFLENLNGS